MKTITSKHYSHQGHRPDIQILRGVSVLAVVFYHLGLPIHGGFLGVDSFFVISGFVITETLLRADGTLKTKIVLFYKKRIRRILPASIYITLLTLLASFLFLPRLYLKNYLIDTTSSFFMVANFRFAKSGVDYLNQTLHSSPFLHFWSLGVEEQFYLLWPILFLSLFRWKSLYYIAIPILFAASIVTTQIFPTASFFFPTSRAWEFMIGAFVATLPRLNSNKTIKFLITIFLWLIMLFFFILANPDTHMFQFFALPIVLVTGALIYIGFSSVIFRPLEHIGNISYSLYLVHWPVIAILLFYFEKINYLLSISIFILSLIMAKFLTDNLENPVRFKQGYLKSKKFWLSILLPILVLCVLAFNQGFSITQKSELSEITVATPAVYSNGCDSGASIPKKTGCDFGDLNSKNLVMLVGDSHAAQWLPGFEKASLIRGFKLRVATKSGCPALLITIGDITTNSKCRLWQKNVLQYINESKPDIVVISNLTENSGGTFGKFGLTPSSYIESLVGFIADINPESKVAVIGDTAYPGRDSAACISLNWRNYAKCDLKNTKDEATEMTKTVANFRTSYLDSRPFFCNAEICPAVIKRKNVYRDGSHLSVSTIEIQEILANQVLNTLK